MRVSLKSVFACDSGCGNEAEVDHSESGGLACAQAKSCGLYCDELPKGWVRQSHPDVANKKPGWRALKPIVELCSKCKLDPRWSLSGRA